VADVVYKCRDADRRLLIGRDVIRSREPVKSALGDVKSAERVLKAAVLGALICKVREP
jgi:hypothetical protein